MVLTTLKNISYQEKREKKYLEKKVKGKNFGGEVGFRVYLVEKIKENGEDEDGKEV